MNLECNRAGANPAPGNQYGEEKRTDRIAGLTHPRASKQSLPHNPQKEKQMPGENDFDFDNEVAIDLDNLHEEWRTHPQVRYKYAKEVAYLDKVVKQQRKLIEVKKAKLKEATSHLILQIKVDNPKATVQQVEATIVGHKEIKLPEEELSNTQNELIVLEYNFNMARNALQAFDDRKTALENEVKLWRANYFASPTEERTIDPGKGIVAKGRDETTQKVRKSMNRKRRKG